MSTLLVSSCFDDGLTSVVPPVALPFVKDTLGLLLELCSHHLSLQTKVLALHPRFQAFWNAFSVAS